MRTMGIRFSVGKLAILPILAVAMLLAPLPLSTPAFAVSTAYEKASAALVTRGIKASSQGKPAVAVTLLEQALVADPANARALAFLGRAWQQQGQSELARKYYELALTVDPIEPDALNWSGQMDMAAGNKSAAQIKRDRLGISCANCPQHRDLADAIAGVQPLNP